jgi:hypothetical protein
MKRTLNKTSIMPDYQWKLTIVGRNLVLSNWIKLMPEAQEQMLEEADELMEILPLSERQSLITSLEILQSDINPQFQSKIQQIFSNHISIDIRKNLELSIQKTELAANSLDDNSSRLMETIK